MEECEYCMFSNGEHHKGCPIAIRAPSAMILWREGRKLGVNDVYIDPQTWHKYHLPFILGYRQGRLADEEEEVMEMKVAS